jgi:hypothetical protein
MRNVVTLAGLALACAGCADGPPAVADVVGVYHAQVAATARLPARIVLLRLDSGNVATMEVTEQAGGAPVVETGTWSLTPTGEVRVVVARDQFGPVTNDISFRWARPTLTAIAFDTLQWGARGFALSRE